MAADMMDKVLEHQRRRLSPNASAIEAEAARIVDRINTLLDKAGLKATAITGGSVAKGTFLADDHDIDIFVCFDPAYGTEDISELLGKAISSLKPMRVHGSRDYFQIDGDYMIEIVPVINITRPEDALNVTDMSPLHVDWVRRHLKERPGLAVEIRLAKQFCKAQGVYGAESFIKGFSGHVLDILIVHYGGFIPLLEAVAGWGGKQVIDIADAHKGKALEALNEAKLSGPLVVIDPVLSDRNAAAALSREKVERFRECAAAFLKKPAEPFFEKRPLSIDEVKAAHKGKRVLTLVVVPTKGKVDVVGSKILKILEHVERQLKANDFIPEDLGWEWDKRGDALLYVVVPQGKLSEEKIVDGPPTDQKEHIAQFSKKHDDVYSKDGRFYARIPRKFRDPITFIESVVTDSYVKPRAVSVKVQEA
ncbi:MAG: nucleotidyltransferase domain-containing protein [archaeon]